LRSHEIVLAQRSFDSDKTNLPKELILSNYFKVRNGKSVSLVIIFNQPSPY